MNMRRFIFFLIVCEFFSLACIAANKTIKGHVVDEFGKNVEFASVYVDSIYAVSDKEGNFSLVVPDGMKQELVISHISYQTSKIPYDVYSKKTSLQLTLKEKTCDLSDVTVVSGKKQEGILGKGVRAPGDVAFHNVRNTKYETGPLFVVNKDYYVKTAKLRDSYSVKTKAYKNAFYHMYVCPTSAHRGFRYGYRRYRGNTFILETTLFGW